MPPESDLPPKLDRLHTSLWCVHLSNSCPPVSLCPNSSLPCYEMNFRSNPWPLFVFVRPAGRLTCEGALIGCIICYNSNRRREVTIATLQWPHRLGLACSNKVKQSDSQRRSVMDDEHYFTKSFKNLERLEDQHSWCSDITMLNHPRSFAHLLMLPIMP